MSPCHSHTQRQTLLVLFLLLPLCYMVALRTENKSLSSLVSGLSDSIQKSNLTKRNETRLAPDAKSSTEQRTRHDHSNTTIADDDETSSVNSSTTRRQYTSSPSVENARLQDQSVNNSTKPLKTTASPITGRNNTPVAAAVDIQSRIPPYSIKSMVANVEMGTITPWRVMIYDPSEDVFLTYTIASKNDPGIMKLGGRYNRGRVILPILMNALWSVGEKRFQRNQPLFQMLVSDADFTYYKCTLGGQSCNTSDFAASLHFGTAFKDTSILPTVQLFPHPIYLSCVREWTLNKTTPGCAYWQLPYREDLSWKDLKPQLVWRGSLYGFLDTVGVEYFNMRNETSIPSRRFRPRDTAVRMSKSVVAKNGTWLDVQGSRKVSITPYEMAENKYQIDLGGAGGTTWKGTLEKLAMPGLLFHHETPAKDWFYDELVPWKHYVPVRTDLTDLREKFEWAEANEDKAQEIAKEATLFVRRLFANRSLQRHHETYFGENLVNFMKAYRGSHNETVSSTLKTYDMSNLTYRHSATCTRDFCFLQTRSGPRSFDLRSSDCYAISDVKTGKRKGPIETCVN